MKAELRHRIRTLMGAFDVNEAELSKATRIPQATIYKLRTGTSEDPKISTLIPIAEFFRVSIGQLYGLEPLPSNLSPDILLEKGSFIELPLINWDQAANHVEIVKKLNHYNWNHWIHTDELVSSPCAFGLEIQHIGFGKNFPIYSKIIVEPRNEYGFGDFLLCKKNNNQSVLITKLIAEGYEETFKIESESNQLFVDKKNITIIGKILGIQRTFDLKVTKSTSI